MLSIKNLDLNLSCIFKEYCPDVLFQIFLEIFHDGICKMFRLSQVWEVYQTL